MYFNDKNNTNIDDEFEQENILSRLLNILSKYKIVILILTIIIALIIMIIIFLNRKVTNYLELSGDDEITIYVDSDYIEPGYNAYNSRDENLENKVEIKSNLDTSIAGNYEITYTLDDIILTRKIIVIEKPADYAYIYLKTVNNSINVYLKLGEEYNEPGYMVFSSTGKNITDDVTITGTVDTSKKGDYKLVYSLVDPNGVTVSTTRTVIVMDSEISLTLSNEEYTNKNITIDIGVLDNYFDYILLPNNEKIEKNTYSYNISENGTYTFKVYNKKGTEKVASITVTNIDKTAPTGTCSGTYGNGKSLITMTAKDTSGIQKYVINNEQYTTDNITINTELQTANIIIYDKAGNTNTTSCTLTKKTSSSPSSSQQSPPQPANAPKITNISKDGVLITIKAEKYDANISGYYFSYTNKRPNKNGGYIETSNTTLQVARLPGTTYVWVEDSKGKISAYKTVTIENEVIINTKGTILQGTTLRTALERKGGSTQEMNKLIARSAMAAGLYTKEAAATTAVTLIGVLDQQYGIRLPYRGGGKNNYYGVSGLWGEKIDDPNYPYRGFDCDGFTHWSYINAGIKINTSREHNYWFWERIPFSKEEAEIGDIISQYIPNNHVKIIVGKTDTGFIVAHANGTGYGVWINVHPYTNTQNFTLIKGTKIESYYEKDTTSYPSGF